MSGGETFGTSQLCTWSVAPGSSRFQTCNPTIAKKLSQRTGARLVAWSVQGDYLRIFGESIEPWRARDLVTRYLDETHHKRVTNEAFSGLERPLSRQNVQNVSPTREVPK